MFNFILLFLKQLFYNSDTFDYKKKIPDNNIRNDSYKKNNDKNILLKIKKKPAVKNNVINKSKKIDKESLILKIKHNLFFIDNLMGKMSTLDEYISYYDKLRDLHEQSKGCLHILLKINLNAPYYDKTALTILNHTNVISELLEVS